MNEKRKMGSPATRRRLVRQWLDSGPTAREFATAHGLSTTSLHRWTQELRRLEPVRLEPTGFIELAAIAPYPSGHPMVVASRGGGHRRRLEVTDALERGQCGGGGDGSVFVLAGRGRSGGLGCLDGQ